MRTRLSCLIPPSGDSPTSAASDIVQKRAAYADSRRRPLVTQKFRPGDVIVTKKGHIRKLKRQVGPYTFELDNRFKINARFIQSKVNNQDPNIGVFLSPSSSETEDVPDPVEANEPSPHSSSDIESAVVPRNASGSRASSLSPNSPSAAPSNGIRSTRVRKKPLYLQDYLT